MPILKHALKKLRRDKIRTAVNRPYREQYRLAVKRMRQKPSAKNLTAVFSALDKAAKQAVIHPNKAGRLKARLAKLLKPVKKR
jgi:small subunit ribosomal protein S20